MIVAPQCIMMKYSKNVALVPVFDSRFHLLKNHSTNSKGFFSSVLFICLMSWIHKASDSFGNLGLI